MLASALSLPLILLVNVVVCKFDVHCHLLTLLVELNTLQHYELNTCSSVVKMTCFSRCASFQCPTFVIGGNDNEFVTQWSQLGHIINSNCNDDDDVYNRRLRLIFLRNFECLASVTKTNLFKSYCCCY